MRILQLYNNDRRHLGTSPQAASSAQLLHTTITTIYY